MRMILARVAMLGVTGTGRANERVIIEQLMPKGHLMWSMSGQNTTRSLYLINRFDDTDLNDLCEVRNLNVLGLVGPGFTDTGLRKLRGWKSLTLVYLFECSVTLVLRKAWGIDQVV
jgi:hypothetical protein